MECVHQNTTISGLIVIDTLDIVLTLAAGLSVSAGVAFYPGGVA